MPLYNSQSNLRAKLVLFSEICKKITNKGVFLHVREHGDDSAEVVGVGEIAEAGIRLIERFDGLHICYRSKIIETACLEIAYSDSPLVARPSRILIEGEKQVFHGRV